MSQRKRHTPELKAKAVLEVLKETKSLSELASAYGVHSSLLTRWKDVAVKDLAKLFVDPRKRQGDQDTLIQELYGRIGLLSTQVEWLKKNLVTTLTIAERRDLIEWNDPALPVSTQAHLLGLSRSGLYYTPKPPSAEEVTIKRLIDEIYTAHPFYGSRRMEVVLARERHLVNRKRVQHYMQEMGIAGICPGRNLSKACQGAHRFPYLLRNVEVLRPNHVWGIDITYIRLRRGWMYLVAVLDWFSRYVVSWELDQTLEMPFVIEAVGRALSQETPEIFNSDQGSHFTSPQYIDLVKGKGARISMDGRGRAMDNIFTERLWRSVKYEEVYLKDYESPRDARQGIGSYLAFYNRHRPHQSLGYKTPEAVYYAKF